MPTVNIHVYCWKVKKCTKEIFDYLKNQSKVFFLWGTRQTGKTTLLKACYPDARRIDLLKTDELMRYAKEPSLLREEVAALSHERLIVIDEIQKIALGWEMDFITTTRQA